METIKGYKVFNPDWTCRGFQYEVGKTFEHNGNIEMCGKGFHFCRKASDCFNYYSFNSKNKVAGVEALGLVETDGDKSVTNKIRIIREIPWQELLTIVNEGNNCTGRGNTGDWNTGDRNTGDWNTGNCNTGSRNTGDYNTGNYNTGDYNTGNCNTGNWNTGSRNTGFFNTITPPMLLFNKPTDLTMIQLVGIKGVQVLNWNYENNWWIYSANMSKEEKKAHPEHEYTGGYLKSVSFKEACRIMWDKLTDEEKEEVKKIPNFDADVFKRITGVNVK